MKKILSKIPWIVIGLGLLDSWPVILNGVGNAAQRVFGVSYGIEVEPVYLLANYGVLGFLLRYALVLLVLVTAYRLGVSPDRLAQYYRRHDQG